MYNESLIERRTVEEVLNGREVGILKMVDTMASPLRSLGISVPDLGVGMYKLTESSFGFIRMRDNQTFGPMETYTGQTTASRARFNNFASVEGKTSLPFYRKRCNAILGTDGTFFGAHPPANKNATLYIFNMHICRPMKFIFEGESSVQLIKTYRYMADYRQFSIVAEPENWCFCPEDENITRCEGVLFMRQCLDGAPLVLSNPHFLYSPRLMAKVRGLSPNYEKHQGYIEVERTLGTSTEVILKMQLNVDMKPYSAVNSLSKFRPVIMPWIWVEEVTIYFLYIKFINFDFLGYCSSRVSQVPANHRIKLYLFCRRWIHYDGCNGRLNDAQKCSYFGCKTSKKSQKSYSREKWKCWKKWEKCRNS